MPALDISSFARRLKAALREAFGVCSLLLKAISGLHRVLLVEYNVCHQEVVAGFDYILRCVGAHHLVLVDRSHFFENDSYFRALGVSPFYLEYNTIKWLLTSRLSLVFSRILVCSSYDYHIGSEMWLAWPPGLRQSQMLYVVHDPANYISASAKGVTSGSVLIRLSQSRSYYFPGECLQLSFNPDRVCRFLGSCRHASRQPFSFLIAGTTGLDLCQLRAAAEFMWLLYPNAFMITVTGHHCCDPCELRYLASIGVSMVGRVTGMDLLECVAASRFIIAPLDNQAYIKRGAISASVQMSLGFLRPLVVAKQLASDWIFPLDICVSYEDNLSDGLVDAFNMDDVQYDERVLRLRDYRASSDRRSANIISSLVY